MVKKIDYNKLAEDYGRYRNINPEVFKGLFEKGGFTEKSKVLEVGCGTGNYISEIQKSNRCKCWGIDPSEEMILQIIDKNPDVVTIIASGEKIPPQIPEMDLIFSVDVIHHMNDIAAYYREAYNKLADTGKICTVTDSTSIIRNRLPLSKYFPETIPFELERYPIIDDLKDELTNKGFTNVIEKTVEFPYLLKDISSYKTKVFSSLHLISDNDYQQGLKSMERDLAKDPIKGISRYTMLWAQKL